MSAKLLFILLISFYPLVLSGQSIRYMARGEEKHTGDAALRHVVDSLNHLSDLSIDSSYSASYLYSIKALEHARTIQYDSGKIRSMLSLGRYFSVNRKYVTAFELFFQALSLANMTNNQKGVIDVTFRIGQAFNTIKNPTKAIEYLTKSLAMSSRLHDTVSIIEHYSVLGFAYNSLKDSTGDKYFYLTLALAEKTKDSIRIRSAYRNLGILFNSRNDHFTALYFYQKALDIKTAKGPSQDIGALYSLIAHEWQQLKQYEKSLRNHHLALEVRRKQNRHAMVASSLLNMGNLFLDWGKYDSSRFYLEKGLSLLEKDEFLFLQQYGYMQLYHLYGRLGNAEKSLDAFQKYIDATERLLKESNQAELTYIESNYLLTELEQQNRELQNDLEIQKLNSRTQNLLSLIYLIVLILLFGIFSLFFLLYRKNKKSSRHLEEINLKLDQQIKERIRFEEALAENVRQKELLLREIHHRVKNNFAILVSLMTLQKITSENEELHTLIDELQIRVRTMSLVHELLYRSESLDVIPFAKYLDQLINIVSSTYSNQKINLEIDVDPCTLNISVALPLGLIVNELLTNAFKYAFPGNPFSELHISLKSVETDLLRKGNWKLIIRDNGPGLPDTFNLDTASSLGSQIVRLLVEQIEGEIFITNDGGACFTILFNDKMN